MIRCERGEFYAIFNVDLGDGRGTYGERRDVVAWSDDGIALVLCDGFLRAAPELRNFAGVQEGDGRQTVIPGGGWVLRREDGDDPVVAWLIGADGFGKPLFTDSQGMILPEDDIKSPTFITHPDYPWTDPSA